MNSITLAVRTYSDVDMDVYGAYKHIQDDSFEIMLIAYAIDDNPVEIVDITDGESMPVKLRKALLDTAVCKFTLDSIYERRSIEKGVYDMKKMIQKGWISVFSVLNCFGLPKDLDEIAELYNMIKPKCDYIHKYDSFFSKPMCAPKIKKRVMPEEYPVIWKNVKEYVKWQVDTMRNIVRKTYDYCRQYHLNIFRWAWEYELINNIISDRNTNINAAKLKDIMLDGRYKSEANSIYLRLDRLNRYNNTDNGSNDRIDILKQVLISPRDETTVLFDFKLFKEHILGWIVGETFTYETISLDSVSYMCERISRAVEYVVDFKQHVKIGRMKIYWRDGSVWIKVNNKVRLVYMNLTISRTSENVGFTYIGKREDCINKITTSSERIYTDIINAVIKDLVYMVVRELINNNYTVYCRSDERILLSCPSDFIENVQDIVNYTCMRYLN